MLLNEREQDIICAYDGKITATGNLIDKEFKYDPPIDVKKGEHILIDTFNGDITKIDEKGKAIIHKANFEEEHK